MQQEQIGLIGAGLLGSAMAERFIHAEFAVLGFDTDAARRDVLASIGAGSAASAVEVASSCRRIVLSLPHSGIADTVLRKLGPHLQPGQTVIDTTTGAPEAMEEFGQSLAARGVHYLDATVGGSSKQVRAREAIVIVGGEAAIVASCAPLFDSFAYRTFHVGACGAGARMKLVMNLVLGLNRAVLAEGLAFAGSCGLSMAAALEVLRAGPAYSKVMDTKGGKMLARDFAPQARLAQHLKDVNLILAMGGQSGARLPLSTAHKQLLEQAAAAGHGGDDNSAIIEAFR